MSIYDDIKTLMAEAEAAHRDVDRRFEAKLQARLQAEGLSAAPAKPTIVPIGQTGDAKPRRRSGSGAVRDAVQAVMADGQPHKLADLMRETGKARGSIFNALARMVEREEVVALGDGMYQNTPEGGASEPTLLS
jgi:hypothetical protein